MTPATARTAALALLASTLATWASAGPPGDAARDRLWIMWESRIAPDDCAAPPCGARAAYTTRLLDTPPHDALNRTIGLLDRLALSRGLPVEHPQAPRVCQAHDPEVRLGFRPEPWPLSPKPDALAGLEGVHVSVLSLKAPAGFEGDFGGGLQTEIERRFRAAGIRLLTEDERLATPGKPKLNVYFSNTDPVSGCQYSVFMSLTQTVLLTRNLETKLEVGTWGMAARYSADFPDETERDTILRVIDAFIADYTLANADRPVDAPGTAARAEVQR